MPSEDFEIIDAHFHLFRSIDHEKTGIQRYPPPRDRDRFGTPERLVPYMARTGISKVVFVNWVPTHDFIEAGLKKLPATLSKAERAEAEEKTRAEMPERVRRHNMWVCEVGRAHEELIPFIGIQPILGKEGMVEEVLTRLKEGAKGVKIIPAIHEYFPNDKIMWPLYETCQRLGVPIITDSGPLIVYGGKTEYSRPIYFAEVLKDFPRLTLVMAHLGHAYWDERVEMAKEFPNLCFDTSQGFSTPMSRFIHGSRGLCAEDVVRTLRKIGTNRIMFGSDGPRSFDPLEAAEEIMGMDLTDDEKRMILAGNAKRILNL